MATVSIPITADADDGFDTGSAWKIHINNYGGSDGFTIQDAAAVQQGGVRFLSVGIPNGATINSATITLTARSSLTSFTSLTAYGDDVDSAAAWGASSRPTSGFTDTTSGTAQTTMPASGTFTLECAVPVQEIVDRAGWSSGNNMRFRLFPIAGYAGGTIFDLDGSHSSEAVLDIDYTVGGGGSFQAAWAIGANTLI